MKEINVQPDWSRVDITITKEARERLSAKRIAVIGIGSLGSEVATLLAMTGVGKFILVDPDTLEAGNIVRYSRGGLKDVGKKKVDFIASEIQQINPGAEVTPIAVDATKPQEIYSSCDLAIIAGLGDNSVQAVIAEEFRRRGVNVLETAVYEKAGAGEVFLVKASEGPCYACFSAFLNRAVGNENRQAIDPYGIDRSELPSFPALAIHINRIATIAAEASMQILLGAPIHEDPRVNLLIFSNQEKWSLGKNPTDGSDIYLNRLRPAFFIVNKRDSCLVCNTQDFTSKISQEELDQLMK